MSRHPVMLSLALVAVVLLPVVLMSSEEGRGRQAVLAADDPPPGMGQCAKVDHIEVTQATQRDPCSDPEQYPDGCDQEPPTNPDPPLVDLIDARYTTIRVYMRPDPNNFTCGQGTGLRIRVLEQLPGGLVPMLGGYGVGEIYMGPPWDRAEASQTMNASFGIPPSGTDERTLVFRLCAFPYWQDEEQYCSENYYQETRVFHGRTTPDIAGVGINYRGDGGPIRANIEPGLADRTLKAVWPFRDYAGQGGYRLHVDYLDWPNEEEAEYDDDEFITNGTFDNFDDWTDISTGGASATAAGGTLRLTVQDEGATAGAEIGIALPAALVDGPELRLELDVFPTGGGQANQVYVEAGTTAGLNGDELALSRRGTRNNGWYWSLSPRAETLYLRVITDVVGVAEIDNLSLTTHFNVWGAFSRLADYLRIHRSQSLYGWFRGNAFPEKFPVENGGWALGNLAFGTSEGETYHLTFGHEACHLFGMRNGHFTDTDEYGWDVINRVGVGFDGKHKELDDITNINTGTALDEFWVNPGAYLYHGIPGYEPPRGGGGGQVHLSMPVIVGDPWSLGHAFETEFGSMTVEDPYAPDTGLIRALDLHGSELLTTTFGVSASCNGDFCGDGGVTQATTRVDIPTGSEVHSIELYREDVLQDVITRSTNAPAVTILSPLPGATLDESTTVSWEASDADGDMLQAHVQYSHDGETWIPLGLRLRGTQVSLAPEPLPSGNDSIIRVVVSDGFNTTTDSVGGLQLGPNRAPNAFIHSPEDGAVFSSAEMVGFVGSAYDLEDGLLNGTSVAWYSDITGHIGYGTMLTVSGSRVPTPPLTPGIHVIEFRATDSLGATDSAYVTIEIQ